MLLFAKPSPARIQEFLKHQAGFDFSYRAVGATAAVPPPGFAVDHCRVRLGQGKAVFEAAKSALQRWGEFRLGWVEPYGPDTPIQAGQVVAVLARIYGLWTLNACRIVYVVDEPQRFGFAYGTLPDHAESGEERFLVERSDDGSIWYDIFVFSRPRHLLAKLGYPLTRYLQRRFRQDSAAAMQRSVSAE